MHETIQILLDNLNHPDAGIRLDSLRKLMGKIAAAEIARPQRGTDVNNHIHTTFSFSPYSPAKAVWMAYNAGLATAGIMDHDTISGAEEFIEAGKIAGIATTIGIECRADFSATPLKGRRINNPDQRSIAYVAIHGIPHTQIENVKAYLAPYTQQRNKRNRQMTEKINAIFRPYGIELDFSRDIEPLSMCAAGGSMTERHILYGLSLKLIEHFGKGPGLVGFLKSRLKLSISAKLEGLLLDAENPYYAYDLLGLLKGELVASVYIEATDECPDISELIAFAKRIGAVSAYAYLGDVGDSVTGDKKTQKFEDDYIELLFQVIKDLGFDAVTYMPSRNSMAQLDRLRALCKAKGFFQISGEDINSPRQAFVCEAMRNPGFQNLKDAAWALIGHESEATKQIQSGMFSPETLKKHPDLESRIALYKEAGLKCMDSMERR